MSKRKKTKIKSNIHRYLIMALLMLACPLYVSGAEKQPVTYFISRAESFVQSNAWTAAKREIDEGLAQWPENAELRYLNGNYFYVTGRLQEARYNLIRAIQTNDQHFKAKRVMVDVEDASKHYSSAICYINELLEFQPYDRDLWRRKIALYRKINNNVEADAALERLARIYPNDTIVRNDLKKLHRANVDNILKKSNAEDAAAELERWLDMDPENLSYYIELMGIYQRLGYNDRALGVGNRGLSHFPSNRILLNKVVGLLSEMGNYTQALVVAKQYAPHSSTYRYLLEEATANARNNDPYEMNGRLYAETHNRDALDYLLNTSLTRGYYDDARVYIKEAMKREGRTTTLLMKLYTLEKRSGDELAMRKILQELYEKTPEDEELKELYAEMMMKLGTSDMAQEQWADASTHLQRAIELMSVENEAWPSAVSMRIVALARQNKFDEACEQYKNAIIEDPKNKSRYAYAYEEFIANRIHLLIEEENYEEALLEGQNLLDLMPESETALRTCINMSQTLKREEQFQKYAQMGYDLYPENPYFIVKQAMARLSQDRYAEALDLVNPQKNKNGEYESPLFISAHSGIANEWALELLKNKMPDIALQVVDTALVYDPANKELLYSKGLIYEGLKDYPNAYDYQKKYYEPSNAEQAEYYQHMRYLGFRSLKNRIDASYSYAFYDNEDTKTRAHLYSLATVTYSRVEKKDTYTGQISYKGIDGYHNDTDSEPGGVGLEFMGQWEHTFNHRWSGMVNLALSTQYFNKVGTNVSASYALDHGWTPTLKLGYRRTPKTYLYLSGEDSSIYSKNSEYNLFILAPSVEKAWERIRTSLNVDFSLLDKDIYYNIGLKGKLFFNDDNISSISLLTGFGSFPELKFFEQTALRNVSHTNAMVGFDAQYLCTRHMYIGISGSWNTCYNPYKDANDMLRDAYRNIYSLTFQLHLAF